MTTGSVDGVIGGWFMPASVEVDAEGEQLVVTWDREGLVRRTSRPELLGEFTNLGEARDASTFVKFAKRWGVLEPCEHGYPHRHEPGDVVPLALPDGHTGEEPED